MATATRERTTVTPSINFAERLQQETIGVRITRFAMNTRRSMGKSQVDQVADIFEAESDSVGGNRKVLNRKHDLLKPVFASLRAATAFLEANTIDYPEKGTRLIKTSRVEWLEQKMSSKRAELQEHLQALDAGWDDVIEDARGRLGDLFNAADYSLKPSQRFGFELSFPAIKPDDRLMQLHPDLYAAEQRRIQARFDEAIKNAEAAAAEELGELLKRFVERLTDKEDGKKKALQAGVIDDLTEFAERFKTLSIGSNKGLDELVEQVEALASGMDVKEVRKADQDSRAQLAEKLAGLTTKLDALVITRPSRRIDLD